MVKDSLRTTPLLHAVVASVKKGDIVLDIGTGLGLLAIAAAKAGAKEVIACDCDQEALLEAKQNAVKERMEKKICFVKSLSFDLTLPRKADLLICETVGSFAFDENILATVAHAKQRLLKRGGRIIPESLELWGVPIERYPKLITPAEIALVKRDACLAKPKQLARIEFKRQCPTSLHIKENFRLRKDGTLRAFALWPKVTWMKGHTTDASPFFKPTHWKQGILPLKRRNVKKGESVQLTLIIRPHPSQPQLMTERLSKEL